MPTRRPPNGSPWLLRLVDGHNRGANGMFFLGSRFNWGQSPLGWWMPHKIWAIPAIPSYMYKYIIYIICTLYAHENIYIYIYTLHTHIYIYIPSVYLYIERERDRWAVVTKKLKFEFRVFKFKPRAIMCSMVFYCMLLRVHFHAKL